MDRKRSFASCTIYWLERGQKSASGRAQMILTASAASLARRKFSNRTEFDCDGPSFSAVILFTGHFMVFLLFSSFPDVLLIKLKLISRLACRRPAPLAPRT